MGTLTEYLPGQFWIREYPIRYAGARFDARMTVVRLKDGTLWLHSPCEIDAATKRALDDLGEVAFIVAPGNYHHLHVPSAQRAFPEAKTFICPGVEKKSAGLAYDGILDDVPLWPEDFEQVLLRGSRYMWEVLFFHARTRTLLLVDAIENFTDDTPGANWALKLWWKVVFRMWGTPKPAPEYQLGWKDKEAARRALNAVLEWDFERIILSHGDLVEADAKQVARSAWAKVL